MASRSIYCTNCKRYLGVIRDAKLHKNIHHLCDNCNTMRIASDMGNKTGSRFVDGGEDFDFNDMFKGFRK